ncbi:hypothetical protein ACOB87_10850 [Streptomyces sp. YS-B37]|uniref:hypothetical protein n=1 Tax=Streptomyces sp. YS-B37 TaxID=3407669 RepID=UPI003B500428
MTDRPAYVTGLVGHNSAGEASTNRERQLAQPFVVPADTCAVGFDPLHLFHCLVHACRDLLDVDVAFAELLQLQSGRAPAWTAVAPESR